MRSQIIDRQKYVSAHRKYNELNDLLSNLSNKLSDVSKDVDREFLSSYRVHMLAIQSEIKNLSEDVEKGVQTLKSDQTIAKLEEEVTWFVDECTRLKMHFNTMINDCKQMQSRYNAMKEQKIYLNQQLKATMKINRVLQAEVDFISRSNKNGKSHYLKEKSAIELQADNYISNEVDNLDDLLESYDRETEQLYHHHDNDHEIDSDEGNEHIIVSEKQQVRVESPSKRTIASPSYQEYLIDQQRPEKIPLSTNYFIKSPTKRSHSPSNNNRTSRASNGIIPKVERLLPTLVDSGHNDTDESVLLSRSHHKSLMSHKQQQLPSHNNKRPQKDQQQHSNLTSKNYHSEHKKQLILFLQKKSVAEAALEKSIASVFEEVKARKMVSAKHSVVRRYTNAELINTDGNGIAGGGVTNNHHSNILLDQEVELLNQPLIQLSGGISGLGTSQLSDNDRFSCIVKYLLNYDRFKEVVKRIQTDYAIN